MERRFRGRRTSFCRVVVREVFLDAINPVGPVGRDATVFGFFPFGIRQGSLFVM